ncbi:MAG: asparagine--tRNA ligase [Treponema sp.]|jgi:asparaginyl-tRNA synthetase|nr:asparagine--tRNA ligase [Treponema sp.]
MFLPLIKEIFAMPPDSREVTVRGWVRTKRDMKNLVFIEVNDGSSFAGIQCTFDRAAVPAEDGGPPAVPEAVIAAIGTGASVEIRGRLVPSPASGQAVEVAAEAITLIGEAPVETNPGTAGTKPYPLQKKRHSLEFLREIAHLRPRTNTFGAVTRVRNRLAFAIHQFFQERGFQYIHTPIITASDAEGAGAMFQVTTLDLEALAKNGGNRGTVDGGGGAPEGGGGGLVDFGRDFFGRRSFLTVSGQLEAETYASALSRVYTFGPTFRAEKSNTVRHLAEFWMVEPEAAFAVLEDDMALAEDFLKYLFATVLRDCAGDLEFFASHIEKGVIDTLQKLAESRFTHITYTDAIAELEKAAGTASFEFKPYWGCDLQSEHEKFLTEEAVRGPVIVTDYPKEIKAFYMKMNDDGKTVRAMDVLVPRLGEIIGGSQREEDPAKLARRMTELGMNAEDYSWYLDLRRYGTVPHAGFGLGFERLIQYVTGMANIRDVIPFPRALGQAEF